ncbi:MAG TPA: hypothetical protein PLM63_01055 [bacterium]|nr:hypothetical protein [Patescibacteria group bacterium]HOC96168.1 hypothetical protein [bacterium]HPO11159.1 hypothetical protein [bacterium]
MSVTNVETMHSKKLTAKAPDASTQRYLDIAEIRDDVVIMKDGSLRGVIMTSSINFALKSPQEQEAVIASYVRFLNTIDFPIQILIQSRRLDLDSYINELNNNAKNQKNELLKAQIYSYIEYIQDLIVMGDIMTKKFFVVCSYSSVENKKTGKKSFFERAGEFLSPTAMLSLSRVIFERYKLELQKRLDHVRNNLGSMGIAASILNTQELIELYYSSYNINVSRLQKLKEVEKLKVEM